MNPDERPLIPPEYAKAFMESQQEEIQRMIQRIPLVTTKMLPKTIHLGVQPQSTVANPTEAELCYRVEYRPIYQPLTTADAQLVRLVGQTMNDKMKALEEEYYFGHAPTLDIPSPSPDPVNLRQCSICHGSGRTRGRNCYGCKGSGQITKGIKKGTR